MPDASIGSISSSALAGDSLLRNDRVSGNEFLQLLVTQLRHQDPMEPLSSEEFMAQMAQFQSLEELIRMNDFNSKMVLNQQLAAAGSLIGREVGGISSYAGVVQGRVNRVWVENDKVYLDVDGVFLEVDEIMEVSEAFEEQTIQGEAILENQETQ